MLTWKVPLEEGDVLVSFLRVSGLDLVIVVVVPVIRPFSHYVIPCFPVSTRRWMGWDG